MTDTPAEAAIPPEPQAQVQPPANWVGAAILAVWLALGAALVLVPGLTGPLTFAFVMVGWVLAVMLHEFCHALVAWLAGDHTVAAKGYLSFDPRRYGDLGTSLVIPMLALLLGGVGFPGGAVYLRVDLMRTPLWRTAAALAGPGATLVVLLALTIALKVWTNIGATTPLFPALTVLAYLQAMALILNLLPIPGLDGFNAISPFLPAQVNRTLRRYEGITMLALIALLFLVPAFGAVIFGAAAKLGFALGLQGDALAWGWRQFHFWQ